MRNTKLYNHGMPQTSCRFNLNLSLLPLGLEHPIITFSGPTWMNTHCLPVLWRGLRNTKLYIHGMPQTSCRFNLNFSLLPLDLEHPMVIISGPTWTNTHRFLKFAMEGAWGALISYGIWHHAQSAPSRLYRFTGEKGAVMVSEREYGWWMGSINEGYVCGREFIGLVLLAANKVVPSMVGGLSLINVASHFKPPLFNMCPPTNRAFHPPWRL